MLSPQSIFSDPDLGELWLSGLKELYSHSKADLVGETSPHVKTNLLMSLFSAWPWFNCLISSLMHGGHVCVCVVWVRSPQTSVFAVHIHGNVCGNTAAAQPGMRYQVCGGACYLSRSPLCDLSWGEALPQPPSCCMKTQTFIRPH